MPLRVNPDVELLAVRFLRARAEVAALVATRVFTELPANPVFPLVAVHRIGGLALYPGWVDVARIQVDSWGETKFQAREVAATALAALREMPGVHDFGVVSHVAQDLGLQWLPDPESDRPRYLFGVSVYLHPNPA